MAEGGGFCEKHGPFDPPYLTCPYCALEEKQRRAYGPPPDAPAGPAELPEPVSPAAGFVRQTVEPVIELVARPGMTEPLPRPVSDLESVLTEGEASSEPLGWLIVKEPAAQRGEVLPVRANQVIGREGDVRWDDPRLSRQHARLTVEPPEDAPDSPAVFHLWPFGSTNPVYINDREIRGATPLHENDEIRLGNTLFVFKMLLD